MTRDRREPLGDAELVALLPPDVERQLAEALRAAWSPQPLEPAKNELLIGLALEDPLAPPSEIEVAESERLRRALEGDGDHPYADLARAVASAGRPSELERTAAQRLVESARGDDEPSPSSAARRGNLVYVVFGAAAATLALAASIALFVGPMRDPSGQMTAKLQDLAVSRSTASMFHEKFETAETTERVDRIALTRARELRSNRYALWGVR
jgi:hypothetical protein